MGPRVVMLGILLTQGCFLFETEQPPPSDDTDEDPPKSTCPHLVVSTEAMTWEDVYHGTSLVQSLEVMNTCEGTGILTASFALGEGALFSIAETGTELVPNASFELNVVFSPIDPGEASDTLTIRGSDGAIVQVSLSGGAIVNPDWDGDGYRRRCRW